MFLLILQQSPGVINSEIEELQQEVSRLHQQLQLAEDQIRAYEPDPLKMTSMEELESSEKNLVETLTRVAQRKEYLLSSHLSTYDPSAIQGMPSTFENVGWLQNNGSQSHNQIFDASTPLDPLRDLQSSIYDPFPQGTNSQSDSRNIGECHVTNQNDTWPQGYTLYSHLQHEIVGPDMSNMMTTQGQLNLPITASNLQPPNNEAGDQYECEPQNQLNTQ
ncbi:hypothetical protein PIB30_008970 [Stylosanthes scabra]|uniref:K-box domain-containing protein n=1 Tax=Stylosanthes scabra TaxID=79078 RepID=A0ABU6S4N5_9FABA|nr:hypothetical protein [Stylosanthes scabra]